MIGVAEDETPDTARTRAELQQWVGSLDQAIADLRVVIAREERELRG